MPQLFKIPVLSMILSISFSIFVSADRSIPTTTALTDTSAITGLFKNQNRVEKELDPPTEYQQKLVVLNNYLTSENLISKSVTEDILHGDVNNDGNISLMDAILGLKLVTGLDTAVGISVASDINDDGKIGVAEIIYILQFVSGLHASNIYPINQFNIGDSIGEGEAANGNIGSANHHLVWSTGYQAEDIVYSLNERFEDHAAEYYDENNATMDVRFNKAVSGAILADFVTQANNVVAEATLIGGAGMVTVLLGNNDVCASSLDGMTDPLLFEQQYRDGLGVLASSPFTRNAEIHISSIPDIYWLWVAKKDNSQCNLIWWFGNVCQALLQNPEDDCESVVSRDNPDDTTSYNDGPNCIRRKEFHEKIKDTYNPILRQILQEYKDSGALPNAYFVDIFDVKFDSSQVNDGDCFHPSVSGHKLLADEEWCRSHWGKVDPLCTP